MASAEEAAIDQRRALQALIDARRHLEALDGAETVRTGAEHRSALRTALEHGQKAAERVLEFLGGRDPGDLINGRDGGPL